MTAEQLSRLNYIIGRIEGIASGTSGDIQNALLYTAEMLNEMFDEVNENIEAESVALPIRNLS